MEKILKNYNYLLSLSTCNDVQCKRILENSTKEQLDSILECVKVCNISPKCKQEKDFKKLKQKTSRTIKLLKQSRKLAIPCCAIVLSKLISLALDYVQTLS